MWRPRGERGLSSCRSRFITLARASPRRRGLRSRGAGSPMTNVPVSRQQAPPGPATPSAQQVPGECLRVSVSGKELLKAPSFQKGCKDSSASPPSPRPGSPPPRAEAAPGGEGVGGQEGTSREFPGWKALLGEPDPSFPPSLTWIPPRLRPRGRSLPVGRGAWAGSLPGDWGLLGPRGSVQAGRPGPVLCRVSICRLLRLRGTGREPATVRGREPVRGDLSRPRRRPLGPQKQLLPARIFGKPEGRACVAEGGAAPSAAALARVGLVPSPGRRRGGSRAAPRADKRGRQHLRRPRRVISTGWERSAF